MAEVEMQEDITAHLQTYHAFNKLVTFGILAVIITLSCMALGLVGHAPVIAVLLGVGGNIALLIAFAVLN
jgi:Bacterial aa3 type cytochrome c oxidase subunit IV